MKRDELFAGVYRHYKGPLYLVMGLAHDANAPGRVTVLYVPLQLDEAHPGPRLAVRTLEDFNAVVCADPDCELYGQEVLKSGNLRAPCKGHPWADRFDYVSAQWTPTTGGAS